jgi:putative spermidine/putrescine transport system substrate-binding protein
VQTEFERGEVNVTIYMDIMLDSWKKAGIPVAWQDAEEGNLGVVNTVNVCAGTKNKDLAMKFVNFMLSPDVQAEVAKYMTEAPVNQKTQLDADVASKVAYGPDAMQKVKTFDNNYINQMKPTWIEWFMQDISTTD